MVLKDYSNIPLSKGLSSRLDVQEHLVEVTRFETIIFWLISSDARTRTNLASWFRRTLDDTDASKFIEDLLVLHPNLLTYPNVTKVKVVLDYVNKNIKYVSDGTKWKLVDKWQTPEETWNSKTGDCEDGAMLIYSILRYIGVPEVLLRIAVGDVKGGGHCYVVWRSDENGLEYPIDWCYWYSISNQLRIRYSARDDYLFGKSEWFSFNYKNTYKGTKKVN